MINVLSVDVEDYYQVEAFARSVARTDWPSFPSRVEDNVMRILDMFDAHGARATFFVLGYVARKSPSLVREIAARGHEIGCHGFGHQHLKKLTRDQFREDLRSAHSALADEAQNPVRAYRAPSFSITRHTLWALDVLAEEGFTVDSSVFPVRHDFYGIPGAPRFPYWHATREGNQILEFPPSTFKIGDFNVGVAGGGYFRFGPYVMTKNAIRHINRKEGQPVMVYFHPWEIDPGQPRIAAPLRSRVRHYTNLSGMAGKLERLLRDFSFGTLAECCARMEEDRDLESRNLQDSVS